MLAKAIPDRPRVCRCIHSCEFGTPASYFVTGQKKQLSLRVSIQLEIEAANGSPVRLIVWIYWDDVNWLCDRVLGQVQLDAHYMGVCTRHSRSGMSKLKSFICH